ncbi:MAG: heavy-metal-associated domain-containing protein [Alphaproteobacteria bacterium]|nr:heavy-metal-associated domain-containing protein [Alphaproteobacteria bacterium]HIV07575.1 cation transporter [Candidatus Scatocola faecigallinarum]
MKKTFVLDDLDCANCAAKIENAVREIEGVISASVSFMSGKLVLEAEEERFEEILNAAEKLIAKVDSDVTLVR